MYIILHDNWKDTILSTNKKKHFPTATYNNNVVIVIYSAEINIQSYIPMQLLTRVYDTGATLMS